MCYDYAAQVAAAHWLHVAAEGRSRGAGSDGQAEEAESRWPSEDKESQKALREQEQEQEEAESEDVQEKGAPKDLTQNVKLEHREQDQEEADSKKDGGRSTPINLMQDVELEHREQVQKEADSKMDGGKGIPIDLMQAVHSEHNWEEITSGSMMGVGAMDVAMQRFRDRHGSLHFFADTASYAGMNALGLKEHGACRRFRDNRVEHPPNACYFIPVLVPGHWVLAIMQTDGHENRGWVLNSMPDRSLVTYRAAVKWAEDAVGGAGDTTWSHVPCLGQREVECGCRVVLATLMCCEGLAAGWTLGQCLQWCRDRGNWGAEGLPGAARRLTRRIMTSCGECWTLEESLGKEVVEGAVRSGVRHRARKRACDWW